MLGPGLLGVDIGSVAVSFALIDSSGTIQRTEHRMHKGSVRETLRSIMEECGPALLRGIGLTSTSPRVLEGARIVDPQCALMAGCREWLPAVRSILWVGGERFGLIRLGPDGGYRGARGNSACASGTGSFLDQQARRLGLDGAAELARRALSCTTTPPRISTRCAVFARTDLVHAQQTGCTLEEICDGLCRGLAQNIADTLFGGERPAAPVVFAGGVALNGAVRRHLEESLGMPLAVPPHAAASSAVGAALLAGEGPAGARPLTLEPGLVAEAADGARAYFFAPLQPAAQNDADATFDGAGPTAAPPPEPPRRLFSGGRFAAAHPVEVEIYTPRGLACGEALIGIDVGSTSTKAILIDAERAPVAGFYTRTRGSPLEAVQALCEAVRGERDRQGVLLRITGAATTGAGRKFIGAMVRADLVVDEITAHARAAYELDPGIDTIIEIGGQDAKFTTMRDGMVTFSHMNTVCAAGTGSFLEEQAERLGCGLEEYARRVRGVRAPLASDRCAVFMERDINTFLGQGFSTEEILAAALFSVRENYLSKVARGAAIGDRIAFQGATARNGALVAAFREGLGKPILVSRYCHLAGALGAALLLAEKGPVASRFIGLDGLSHDIPIRSETCMLCGNRCRLRISTVAGETVAYGFLCGRDYNAGRRASTGGFDLAAERSRAFDGAMQGPAARGAASTARSGPVIGIPAALGLHGQLPLWKRFFTLLGVPFVTSEGFAAGIDRGREVQGAEFCAPLAALHGHVRHLGERADWIFLPVSLRESCPGREEPRVQCYYTQYSSVLASFAAEAGLRERCLTPIAGLSFARGRTKRELHAALARAGYARLGLGEVSQALDQAAAEYDQGILRLQAVFRAGLAEHRDPSVILLGRAYTVLSPELSKGIPGIFASLGVRCYFQDMVPYGREEVQRIAPLLAKVHWLNAAKILEVACIAADTPRVYPVYVTSFKCSPDSFTLEYFKRILDEKGKPYLILQLDDHDSTLGYETRIEAGVASFRNHAARGRASPAAGGAGARRLPVVPRTLTRRDGRTLLFPSWDPLTSPLLAANLRRQGVDARLLREDPVSIRRAMRQNTGQCLPLSIIAQEAVDLVAEERLVPERSAVWLPVGGVSCNLGMFIPFMKTLLESYGAGAEGIQVLVGDMYFTDSFPRGTLAAYKAYLVGGLLRRTGCRLRPYEREPGATDRALRRALDLLVPAFEEGRGVGAAVRSAAHLFDAVAVRPGRRPRVAVFGDLYVRDNDVMNQGLIRAIEEAGGEAMTTPYADYVAVIARSVFRKISRAGHPVDALRYRAIWYAVNGFGRGCRDAFARFLGPAPAFGGPGEDGFLRAFGLRDEHDGESFENLLKIRHIMRAGPCDLFVQASPAFCCPSLVTEAMARAIEKRTGVPVVSITYDGTGRSMNDAIAPYIQGVRPRSSAPP
jgi:predicted CoA-substrate-specific enzyme activase